MGRGTARDNLPLQLTHFVGRATELAQVCHLLAEERLLTLTGTGGIGKTRLALEAAAQARERFPDGVWLIELASLSEPGLVVQAVAEPLGIRAATPLPLQQILIDFLRSRRLLLVLDNCEHLIHACAALAETLLHACPELHILATSREPMRIGGEKTVRVPALSLPSPGSPIGRAQLLDFESVRLFVDRASAVTSFTVSDEDVPALARLCQRLDGIPLAIELAAARAGALSIEQIAARLDDRFRLLVTGSRTAPARQQTLRAAIDWSYALLSQTEQLLLGRLSVFAGSWTLSAAQHVCAGEGIGSADVLDLLARLVDKSLVLAEPISAGRQFRYRLLESVRHYAQERLGEAQTAAELQRRHVAYYCALAKEVEAHVLWGAADVEWGARLDAEQANLRAALAATVADNGDRATALALVGHLGHYWFTRGDRTEGRTWLEQALARGDRSCGAAWAWALLWAGALAHGQSEYDEAVRLLDQALAEFERLDDQRGIGWSLSFLGHVARARADLERAADLLARAVAAFRAVGDELSVISPLSALGFTVCAQGDGERGMLLLEESVALAQHRGSKGRLAIASLYLGQVAYARGLTSRARDAWERGLRLAREWGSGWGMAECLEGLALIAGAEGHPRRAARLLGVAARLRESIGAPVHPVDRADHEQTLSQVQLALGDAQFAAEWAAGRDAPLDELIEYALAPVDSQPESTDPAPAVEHRLTSREREVVSLIARGLTNRDIAARLVISERTAANHVEHIFNKLGLHSRTQVATWAIAHRLVDC